MSSISKKGSSKSSSTGVHSAVVAAAIQDHLLRSLMPNEAFSPKSSLPMKKRLKSIGSAIPKPAARINKDPVPREVVITENAPPLSLAEKLGVFQPIKVNLTEEEWRAVKCQASARGAFKDVCPICQENLGARQEILLSCSHTFHRQCITSLERFAGQRVCPVCRQHSYEARVIYDATNVYKVQCIVKIQSWWRGCHARKEYYRLRKIIPPQDPRLRKQFFEHKLSQLTDRILEHDGPDVNTFLTELDRSVDKARQIYRQLDENHKFSSKINSKLSAPGDWEEIVEMAFNRDDDTCPICLAALGLCSQDDNLSSRLGKKTSSQQHTVEQSRTNRPVMLLSCSHLFHLTCLESFEHFALEGNATKNEHACPVCRKENYDKICVQTLFSS